MVGSSGEQISELTFETRQSQEFGGLACWLIYGIGIHSFPIIAANTITLLLALAILFLKLRYDH